MIRTRHLLGLAVALAAVASLVLGAGPAAGTTARVSLATPAGVSHYLKSLGIDPRGVVVQRGARNYAGPRCPGGRWTCTTAKRVLQVGTTNQYVCTSGTGNATPPNQTCTISQSGTTNSATCTEGETVGVGTQDCTVTQAGASNSANVSQTITSQTGPTQHGQQTASVTQSGAAVKNALHLVEAINQSTLAAASGVTQMQDAFQSVTVNQTASGKGVNSADLHQTQIQHAQDGTTQSQNTASDGPVDCDSSNPPGAPNMCASVVQTAEAGSNSNYLAQSLSQDEHTKFVASQTQGSLDGGLDGGVHLVSNSGASNDNAHQTKQQSMQAPPGSSQTQDDPLGCCGFSAFGNANTKETVDQSSKQTASGPNAFQQLDIFGTGNSNGSCTISQKASDNSGSIGNSVSDSPCPFEELDTSCSSPASEGPACFSGPPIGETAFRFARLPLLFASRR